MIDGERRARRVGTVGAGLASGQPAVQRGHRADGREGPLERARPAEDKAFAKYVEQPELAKLLPVLYPGVFPNLAALTGEAGRPGGDPAHRDPERDRPRVPELHRHGAGGHAATERRDPADDVEPEPARPARRRPGRVPERAAGVRRRRQHRAASGRRAHVPAGRLRATRPMPRRGGSPRGSSPATDRYQATFPYLGTPHDGFSTPGCIASKSHPDGARTLLGTRPPGARGPGHRRRPGRLIVHAEPELHGVEVEISPTGRMRAGRTRRCSSARSAGARRTRRCSTSWPRAATPLGQNLARARYVQITGGEIGRSTGPLRPPNTNRRTSASAAGLRDRRQTCCRTSDRLRSSSSW